MMDIVIGLLIVAGVGYLAWKHWPKPASADMADPNGAKALVEEIKEVVDVNKDGKVDVADAVETVKKVRKPRAKKK
jgi:hypothetical protein